MNEMIPMIQPNGSVVYVEAQRTSALGELFDWISKGSGIVASGAGAAMGSGLIAASATAAAVIPVVGAIAAAVALTTGLIAAQRAKVKAIRSSLSDVQAQRDELMRQNNELDQMIVNAASTANGIIQQIKALNQGSAGLSGFKDWVQKTFTPQKYYTAKINEAATDIDSLTDQVEGKISILSEINTQMKDLAASLTEGKNLELIKKILLYGGGAAAAGWLLYELYQKLK